MKPARNIMRIFAQLALFVTIMLPAIVSAGVATEVAVNKSVLMNLTRPSERVSIANPSIAELVVISPSQLQINGTRIGTTSLIVWEKGGKTSFFDVRVKGDTNLLENQIREIAPNDNITVEYAHDTIVLGGKAANEETIRKVEEVAQAYAVKEQGGGAQASDQTEAPRYGGEESLSEKKPGADRKVKLLNHIQVDTPQQVLLEVKVAQINKTALKSLGISMFGRGNSAEGFSNQVGAPSGELTIRDPVGRVISQATGIAATTPGLASITPLDPFQLGASFFKPGIGVVLRALATKNMAKVLAEPNLLVKSGQEGKFHAGSRIPYTVLVNTGGTSTTSIEWQNVGVSIRFKPVVKENGLIALKIDPAEVSNISGTLAVNGYPIIDSREVKTDVQLRDGESLIMAGLLQEETIRTLSKVPIMGDIPILGALFRSTDDEIRETELVFFVTPKIVNPNKPGDEPPLPTDVPLTPEQEKEFEWIPSAE